MNLIKRLIRRFKKQNPYVEKRLDNADIIVGENEHLTRKQRQKRFDDYYSQRSKGTADV